MYSKTCIQTPSLYATFIVNITVLLMSPVIRPDPSARSSDPLPRCDFYRPIRLTSLTRPIQLPQPTRPSTPALVIRVNCCK